MNQLAPIRLSNVDPPPPGQAVEVADGILWARLPLPMKLDHVNVYALDDGLAGWTLVDTGLDWSKGRAALAALRDGPLRGRRIHRVVLTHHHPDHVGQAATLVADGAELLATRLGWTLARMLTLDEHPRPTPEAVAFRRRAGVVGAALDAYAAERPFNFADCVARLPLGYVALAEGDRLDAGGRQWQVRLGEGHAPDQITLWAEDGSLVLTADRVLPAISPNIGVHPTEPAANPLKGFLETCARFAGLAAALPGAADPLVLPGHQNPFTGLGTRLRLLHDNHVRALERVADGLAERPSTPLELFPALYGRQIGAAETGLALAEAVAHVNFLAAEGRIVARPRADGSTAWQLA
ncbi:MAG: MBL fold metallo-hydrolase [Pseudomonadota bacterium]